MEGSRLETGGLKTELGRVCSGARGGEGKPKAHMHPVTFSGPPPSDTSEVWRRMRSLCCISKHACRWPHALLATNSLRQSSGAWSRHNSGYYLVLGLQRFHQSYSLI
uniref:Uncharacterized protein n=1 Tax=Chromera velia CCMP2878 TaxID=1169474 RepID=A0A0G4F495_9ALVE|eukprot:Cvel_14963.t1-p1 / transcript=Cvel_14963.t1 / gene=Cvel_14963 / organism=Chromera_velia_CCMP2878 / gene_product=hypothetical protein / transcript_product=hypothetical protein / location=Cvel_scaffold1086:32773-34433(-) / protein_length=106 / sequence_SO=supercontig / SO=protein_coding / is_pseudo=false